MNSPWPLAHDLLSPHTKEKGNFTDSFGSSPQIPSHGCSVSRQCRCFNTLHFHLPLPSQCLERDWIFALYPRLHTICFYDRGCKYLGRWEGVRWLRRNRQSAPEQREAGQDTHPFNSGLLTDFHSFFEKVARIGLLAATNQALHTPASYHPNLLEGSASSCIHFF